MSLQGVDIRRTFRAATIPFCWDIILEISSQNLTSDLTPKPAICTIMMCERDHEERFINVSEISGYIMRKLGRNTSLGRALLIFKHLTYHTFARKKPHASVLFNLQTFRNVTQRYCFVLPSMRLYISETVLNMIPWPQLDSVRICRTFDHGRWFVIDVQKKSCNFSYAQRSNYKGFYTLDE